MKLNLSQHLIVNNKYTISVPGECDKSYGSCDLDGKNHSSPYDDVWYVLTEKAFDVWEGEMKEIDGIVCGRLFNGH